MIDPRVVRPAKPVTNSIGVNFKFSREGADTDILYPAVKRIDLSFQPLTPREKEKFFQVVRQKIALQV